MKIALLAAAALAAGATSAGATVYTVDATANSSSGGSPLATISLTAGQVFKVTANPNDLWSAGALPRYSDAGGLTYNRNATAADDSGQPNGTLIGVNFGGYTQDGFTAPYGALVGRIGTTYTLLGTSYVGAAASTGTLELFYWDSNNSDNSGSILAGVTVVPEPATWALVIAGFVLTGIGFRRRRMQPA